MNAKFKPFTCYFCNKLIEKETENSHVTTCGSVLEPCPNKCGSYIQRSMKARHMKECVNKRSSTLPRLVKQNRIEQADITASPTSSTGSNPYNGIPLVQNTNAYRDGLNNTTNRFYIFEQALAQLQKNFDVLRSRQEQLQARTAICESSKLQIENILYQYQILMEWRKNVDAQFNNLKRGMSEDARNKNETERKLLSLIDEKMLFLQDIRADLNDHKDNFLKEQLQRREAQNELHSQIQNFESFYNQENATVCALWSDHGGEINELKEKITSFTANLEDQKLKHSSIVFDLRAISQVCSENAEKLEIQERELKEIRKSMVQLKLDVEMLDEANNNKDHILPGHIIWKISDFSIKMETAKSNNFILKSPTFHSHHYGYKIRLLIYLNGIKKWKGRHMIACLHVMKGEHDMILPWPCHIEGNVVIRDLQDHSSPKHITKFITAKRQDGNEETEEPQESSSQYIFVPHSQLLKPNYAKEDTLFIEIKINKSRKYQDETSL